MDAQQLKDNFAQVAEHGLDVAEYFYADLFERNPGYRSLFPASMARQQQVLLEALAQIVAWVDNTPTSSFRTSRTSGAGTTASG
jgi:hemoglobin-like flavoprotein